jgi:hypothetical protein
MPNEVILIGIMRLWPIVTFLRNCLKTGHGLRKNAIHTIVVDGVPICAILKRKTHADYWAIQAQRQRDTIKSLVLFDQARQFDSENEMIYYKFAQSLIHVGRVDQPCRF